MDWISRDIDIDVEIEIHNERDINTFYVIHISRILSGRTEYGPGIVTTLRMKCKEYGKKAEWRARNVHIVFMRRKEIRQET